MSASPGPDERAAAAASRPGTPLHVKRVRPSRIKIRIGTAEAGPTRGMWVVVLAYLAAGAALAVAIYRFAG